MRNNHKIEPSIKEDAIKRYALTHDDYHLIDKLVERSQYVLSQSQINLIRQNPSDLVSDSGTVKAIPQFKKINHKIAHIDWINFTVNEQTFEKLNPEILSDHDLILEVSKQLLSIFGFSITAVRSNGAFFYHRSYEIGAQYGLVCHGGQNHTVLVSLNATGLSHANPNWETRLFNLLEESYLGTITRIDLAHDDFDPDFFTVDNMLEQYKLGNFNNGNRSPSVSQAGNWLIPDGRGRTLYIGRRTNGLFARIYEKGLQMGSFDAPRWVRLEVELKSVDRYVPFDVLLRPHHYLAASFPVFARLSTEQEKIRTIKHEVRADINHRVKWGKRQNGSLIELLKQLDYTESQIVEMLRGNKLPKKFVQRYIKDETTPLHAMPRPKKVIQHAANIIKEN